MCLWSVELECSRVGREAKCVRVVVGEKVF